MLECIHPLWVPSTSWHRFTIFIPCQVGLFRQRGMFLSALPILTIPGPYLPRLCLVKVSHMLEFPCHYRQQRECIMLFLTLPLITILLPH
jgi:hypothetical protein